MWWLLYWHEVTGPMRCTWCSSSQTIYYLHQTAIPLPPIPLRKERREGARPAILDTPRQRTKGMAMHLPPHYILNTLFPTSPTPSSFFLSSPPYFAFYLRNNFILSSCSHSCPWLFRSDLLFFFFSSFHSKFHPSTVSFTTCCTGRDSREKVFHSVIQTTLSTF